MDQPIFDNVSFTGKSVSKTPLKLGDYEYCQFSNCDLSNVDFSNFSFTECEFENCNLSNVNFTNTALKTVGFNQSKLIGVDFSRTNPFLLKVSFTKCQLDYSSFYQLKLKSTEFIHCNLLEVDFTVTDLESSVFIESRLQGAIFERSNLKKCDFRTATHLQIDPEQNKISQSKFSNTGLAGLLSKYNIQIE